MAATKPNNKGDSVQLKITSFNLWAPPFNRNERRQVLSMWSEHLKKQAEASKSATSTSTTTAIINTSHTSQTTTLTTAEIKEEKYNIDATAATAQAPVSEELIKYAYENHSWWESRFRKIISILKNDKELQSDIYCIQEFWCQNSYFVEMFKNAFSKDYSLHFLKRSKPRKPEGIAFLFKKSVFDNIAIDDVKFSIDSEQYDGISTTRVGQVALLQHKQLDNVAFLLANTHLTFPDEESDFIKRKCEVSQLLDHVQSQLKAKHKFEIATSLLAGDFNCTITGTCADLVKNDGYKSSFHTIWNNDMNKIINNKNNNKNDNNNNNSAKNNSNETTNNSNDSKDSNNATDTNDASDSDANASNASNASNGSDASKDENEMKADIGEDETFISHLNHAGHVQGCDFIFYQNLSNSKNVVMEPIESYLYPKKLSHKAWPDVKDYTLSDHRALTTVFEISYNQS